MCECEETRYLVRAQKAERSHTNRSIIALLICRTRANKMASVAAVELTWNSTNSAISIVVSVDSLRLAFFIRDATISFLWPFHSFDRFFHIPFGVWFFI